METSNHRLIFIRRKDGLFYCGTGFTYGWSPNFFDVRLFPSEAAAVQVLEKLEDKAGLVSLTVELPLLGGTANGGTK